MACNPPYKRGLTGQWDKCRFPGVLRQDCYDYINLNYDCSGKPYCPDRVVVIEVCDTNAARDDNIKVTLNGVVIAEVLDFSKDERNGYFLISDPSATLDASESSISNCHGTSPGLPISVKRFSSDSIKGGSNIINIKIVQQNFNGNAGAFNIRSYLKSNGKLICGCTIGTVPYGAEGDYTFTYDNCCGSNEVPSCPTPTPAATVPPPTATPVSSCNCCVYNGIIDSNGYEGVSCVEATSESDCSSKNFASLVYIGGFYNKTGAALWSCPTSVPVGRCCGPETITVCGQTGPKCRQINKSACDTVGGIFSGYGTYCPSGDEKCGGYPCRTSSFINDSQEYFNYDEIDFMQRYPSELYGFGFNDYSYPSSPQPEVSIQSAETTFTIQATGGCNITAQLRTTGCCLELEESTGRMYAVGAGTVSYRIISGLNTKCCGDFSLNINGKGKSVSVQDGAYITVEVNSKCKCTKKSPWRTPGGFKPSPCNKGPAPTPGPYRILKNTETGVYQIELNLNTDSGQNDCGCG